MLHLPINSAGTDTTILTLHWAVGLMAEHPDIQEKVAKEIDEVIGRDRLPTLDDRSSLPYTQAAMLETFRCGTVAPVGFPHATMADTTICEYLRVLFHLTFSDLSMAGIVDSMGMGQPIDQ